MNEKINALEQRIQWIDEGMIKIDDMTTYNVVEDIKIALTDIAVILKEMAPKKPKPFKNFLYEGVGK